VNVSSERASLSDLLAVKNVPLANLEADRIICAALSVSRASLHAHPEMEIEPRALERIAEMGARRASGEPLAYIIGDSIFCGRKFLVGNSVLIPRTETEVLTEICGGFLKGLGSGAVFADWCTGSGCIAITLLTESGSSRAYAVDSSKDALLVAARNAARHRVSERIKFLERQRPKDAKDVIAPASLDMITANPPYIPTHVIETLETQVRDHEPSCALDGGADGLDVFRLLLAQVPFYLKPGAPMFLETGGGRQLADIEAIAAEISPELKLDAVIRDQRGIDRFMLWRKPA
jgi:release factor glutamine methyltransferase